MVRAFTVGGAVPAVAFADVATAAAEPTRYLFDRCYDPSQPVEEKPRRVFYGCDSTWISDVEYIYVDGMPAVHYFNQHPCSCTPLT